MAWLLPPRLDFATMITISPLENYPKHVIVLPDAVVIPEQPRRVTRTPTLDGGTAIYDGGYNFGDWTLNISIPNLTSAQHKTAEFLTQKIGRVTISTNEGMFEGIIEKYTGAGTGEMTILVEKRTDNEIIPDPVPAPEAHPFITSPPNGTMFSNDSATFIWDPQVGSENYQLVLKDDDEIVIYDSGILPGTTLSVPVTGIPEDGRKINAFFYYKDLTGSWKIIDYYYWAILQMTSPAIGSQLAGSTDTFVWNLPHSSIGLLYLWVGYEPESNVIFGNNSIAATETSLIVNDLPTSFVPPADLYVTLFWFSGATLGTGKRKAFNFLSGFP
jgi:hypothetical protein